MYRGGGGEFWWRGGFGISEKLQEVKIRVESWDIYEQDV